MVESIGESTAKITTHKQVAIYFVMIFICDSKHTKQMKAIQPSPTVKEEQRLHLIRIIFHRRLIERGRSNADLVVNISFHRFSCRFLSCFRFSCRLLSCFRFSCRFLSCFWFSCRFFGCLGFSSRLLSCFRFGYRCHCCCIVGLC